MIKGSDVLEMLIPEGGWVISGDSYEGIQFLGCKPISKENFEKGFDTYTQWKAQQDILEQQLLAEKAAAKSALLAKLGITAEEAALLLG
jgi:hypothetical protein